MPGALWWSYGGGGCFLCARHPCTRTRAPPYQPPGTPPRERTSPPQKVQEGTLVPETLQEVPAPQYSPPRDCLASPPPKRPLGKGGGAPMGVGGGNVGEGVYEGTGNGGEGVGAEQPLASWLRKTRLSGGGGRG